ncbi:hypothetical protein [Streptomyces sp. NPDC058678]|uniref:hypothetical protein n=1 Tax=Streptomyces sp. NPDC058678 TaxID=3346595 RepID=UPI00364B747C
MDHRPQRIEVIRHGATCRVLIDGEPLPFSISRDSVTVPVDPDERPTVHLALFADRVDVVNYLHNEEETTA